MSTSQKNPDGARDLEFEACLAEYEAVRQELRDRAEAHRRVTEYGLLALGAAIGLIAFVQGQFATTQTNGFPTCYLLLLIPVVYTYLIAVYTDESLAEYIAQTYITHMLRPNMKRILEQLKPEHGSLLYENVWEWDMFHAAVRSGTTGTISGMTRLVMTIMMPIGLPIVLFVIGAIRLKGFLYPWEVAIIAFFFALVLLNLIVMARVREELEQQVADYKKGKQIVKFRWLVGVLKMKGKQGKKATQESKGE